MKKKIEWVIKDANDKGQGIHSRRADARTDMKFLNDNMFAEWMDFVEFPLRIERHEWLLVSDKVVR